MEPMQSSRGRPQPLPTSLMSGATAHTVKPSLEAIDAPSPMRPTKLSFGVVVVGAVATAFGLTTAATVAHLRAHPAPMVQIVSGNPQLKKSSDGDSVRWHSPKATLYFDASLDALGNQARETVQQGFGTWLGSGAKLPSLSFDSTKGATFGQTPNGKSEVMYGPIKIAGHEKDLALTITFSDPQTGEVLEADMIFNSQQPYGLLAAKVGSSSTPDHDKSKDYDNASCNEKYDLQSVATHEAGHFFGLGEDYDAKSATMYYSTGRCETNKRALQSSDQTTMDSLYVPSEKVTGANSAQSSEDPANVSAKGCGGARIGQGSTSGAVSVWSLLGLLAFVGWRRRQR